MAPKNEFKFKDWIVLEFKDIFGFEAEYLQRQKRPDDRVQIPTIRPDPILTELNRIVIGTKKPKFEFNSTLVWGTDVGSIKVDFSPLGSYKIIFRKLIEDANGRKTWICRRLLALNEGVSELTETELVDVSEKILREIDEGGLESFSKEYKGLQDLTINLAADVRRFAPNIFIFEGIRKNDDNNFIIKLGYRGQGVEAPGGLRCEQFNIFVNYDKDRGLIRCWGCEITSPTKRHEWRVSPSDWDEYFSPYQEKSEIIKCIINALRSY